MKMVQRVVTLTMPGDESRLENILNDDEIKILERVITPCPKEGIILYLVRYEKLEYN